MHHRTDSKHTGIIVLLLVVILFSINLTSLYHAGHHCSAAKCSVCLFLKNANANSIFVDSSNSLALPVILLSSIIMVAYYSEYIYHVTLIVLKVRLDD